MAARLHAYLHYAAAGTMNHRRIPHFTPLLSLQFSLASGCIQWMLSKDELKILIVGLDYSGKTTLLEQIKRAYIPQYRGSALEGLPPTIGMNLARVATQRVDVTFWDVGGSVSAALWVGAARFLCAKAPILQTAVF